MILRFTVLRMRVGLLCWGFFFWLLNFRVMVFAFFLPTTPWGSAVTFKTKKPKSCVYGPNWSEKQFHGITLLELCPNFGAVAYGQLEVKMGGPITSFHLLNDPMFKPRWEIPCDGEKNTQILGRQKTPLTKLGRKYNVPHGNHNFSCLFWISRI